MLYETEAEKEILSQRAFVNNYGKEIIISNCNNAGVYDHLQIYTPVFYFDKYYLG